MGPVSQDLRFGFRMLAKSPGLTIVVIIALAAGIGANSAIFSVANSVLLTPLPYEDPDRLVWIRETNPAKGIQDEYMSTTTFMDWKSQNRSFVDMAAVTGILPTVMSGGEPERLYAGSVTTNYFSLLGAGARVGRTFMQEEAEPGKNTVVVLSSGMWERQFGADPDVLGSTMNISGTAYTIIGVMPAGFINARPDSKQPELWIPMSLEYDSANRRGRYLSVIARLKPGVTLDQARADINTIQIGFEQQYPDTNTGWRATVVPLLEAFVGEVRPAINALAGAVCFLLLIACANVANLLLARTAARQKEIAVRMALGAGRRRIIQQLMTENVMLALIGGGLGILLSYCGLKLLIALSPTSIPRLRETGIDARVLGFTLVVSLLSGVLIGLIPALQTSKENFSASLKEGRSSASGGPAGKRLRFTLASAEVALSLVLLIGAGLLVKSFYRLQNVNLGFNPDRILMGMLALPLPKYREISRVTAFYGELVSRVEALPGVQAAAATDAPPLAGGNLLRSFEIEGRLQSATDERPDADFRAITPGYFDVIGVPLLKGRLFNEYDSRQARPVVIINQAMARRYWPDGDPIGERISIKDVGKSSCEIIAVVGDIRNESLTSEPYPQMYLPYTQTHTRSMVLVARTASDPLELLPEVKSLIRDMDNEHPIPSFKTMSQVISDTVAGPRFNMLLIVIFAVIAAGLATLGIYGVISYFVAQRTHEIGVRMALGASQSNILGWVIRHGVLVTSAGVVTGLLGGLALTRFISSLLFGVASTDPYIFAGCSSLIAAASLLAAYVPALRASQVDPMVSLRRE